MNFPSYTFWHLSFKAVHNISPPVCHPSVELYQLPCSNLKQTDSILFLLSSSPTLLPPASHTVPDLQITPELLPYSCHSKTCSGEPLQGREWSAPQGITSVLYSALKPPEAFEPHSKTPSHTLSQAHTLLCCQARIGMDMWVLWVKKLMPFLLWVIFCYHFYFFFSFYQPGSFLVNVVHRCPGWVTTSVVHCINYMFHYVPHVWHSESVQIFF